MLDSAAAAAGRALNAVPYAPADLAAEAARVVREVTGAAYALVSLDGTKPVADPPGDAPERLRTVRFVGGSVAVAAPDANDAMLRELAPYLELAAIKAHEIARRRDVNDVMRHDMRTRLGIGKGYAAMLLRHYDAMTPEHRERAVRGVAEAFETLEEFSTGVLLDDQLEVFGAHPHRAEVPVPPLVEAVRAAFPALRSDLDGAPETVCADHLMVRAVLDALVANAVEAAPDEPVTLAVREDADGVRFEVRDTGPGVPEEERAAIWDRYARTERSRLARAPGMGLGLANVRRLVEAHGGAYGLRADAGETAFWVTFPRPEGGSPES